MVASTVTTVVTTTVVAVPSSAVTTVGGFNRTPRRPSVGRPLLARRPSDRDHRGGDRPFNRDRRDDRPSGGFRSGGTTVRTAAVTTTAAATPVGRLLRPPRRQAALEAQRLTDAVRGPCNPPRLHGLSTRDDIVSGRTPRPGYAAGVRVISSIGRAVDF